jgi:membrane protease YdiL (CAAX protease family)
MSDWTQVATEARQPAVAIATSVLLGSVALLVGLLCASIAYSFINSVYTVETGTLSWNLVSTIVTYTGVAAVGAAFLSRHGLSLSYVRLRRPTRRDTALTVGALLGLIGVSVGLVQLLNALDISYASHATGDRIAENPQLALLFIPVSILVVGPAEEFLYRGVIQTRLREVFDTVPTVLLASLVFASIHLLAYANQDVTATLVTLLFVLFPLGLILGATYEYADNLAVPIVAHGVYNAFNYAAQYIEAVGYV